MLSEDKLVILLSGPIVSLNRIIELLGTSISTDSANLELGERIRAFSCGFVSNKELTESCE